MRRLVWGPLAVLLGACPSGPPPPPPPPPPPQVFLTIDEGSVVVGQEVKGKVNVSGCSNVTQVQLLQGGTFLADALYTSSPTAFTLPAGLLGTYFAQLGIAASLTLTAKVICADGRENTSQPVGVTFFPVASKFSAAGVQVMPDAFVAQGGFSGNETTFIGCVGSTIGTSLGLANTRGELLASNNSVPFACGYDTEISEKSPVTGTRWVMQKRVGAYAINGSLQVTAQLSGDIYRMGVARDGHAIFWMDGDPDSKAVKANPLGGGAPVVWERPASGLVANSTPVVSEGDNLVILSTWQFNTATSVGDVVVFKYNYQTGALVNGTGPGLGPPIILRQTFPALNIPVTPNAALSADGRQIVIPALSVDVSGIVRTTILSCSTTPTASQCLNADRKWTSQTFNGVANVVVPYSAGNTLAVVGPYQVWFLNAQDGTIRNLGEQPLRPSGSLQVLAVQPGLGDDFYILNGPVSETQVTYPMEIIATERAENGELWRFSQGSGESPVAGLYLGVDEGGQTWLRLGPDQVKPLTNGEYRTARGPTPVP